MILRVDAESPVPPYEQIRGQVATMVAAGVLPVGTRLPTIRQLAADLGLAAGTAARAYRELEQTGLIASRGRRGTFVIRPRSSLPAPAVSGQLVRVALAFAMEATQLGASHGEALAAARRALDEVTTA